MNKLTGLWKNTDKNGKPYLKGSFGFQTMVVYPNDYKNGENDPDFYVYTAEKPKQDPNKQVQQRASQQQYAPQNQQGFTPPQQNNFVPPPPQQQAPQQQANINDIPF